jgi:hypothetical protein
MDLISIFIAFYNWVSPNILKDIGLAVAGNVTYDALKSLKESFVKKLNRFFGHKDDAEKYLQTICERKASNIKKPFRDIEDIFEEISTKHNDNGTTTEFLKEIKQWFIENGEEIKQLVINQPLTSPSQKIEKQIAGRDINNVQGTQINYNR